MTRGTVGERLPGPRVAGGVVQLRAKPTSKRWSGYYVAPEAGLYEIVAQGSGEGAGYRLYLDDKLIFDDWKYAKAMQDGTVLRLTAGAHKIVGEEYLDSSVGGRLRVGIIEQSKIVSEAARKLAVKADVVVVAAGFNNDSESEGGDRTFTLPFGQDELIREMAAANKNTIVAVTSGGNVEVSSWIDHVGGLLELWYPGEQGGKALAEIIFGEVNPSGHLPATFEKRWEDNPTYANYYPEKGTVRVTYKEGIFVGYRGYEHNGVKPQFPFGYGLSYTTFKFSNLSVAPATASTVASSGRPALYTVTFDVSNTGSRAGAEVAQVYVGENTPKVPRPGKELKGFARVELVLARQSMSACRWMPELSRFMTWRQSTGKRKAAHTRLPWVTPLCGNTTQRQCFSREVHQHSKAENRVEIADDWEIRD